ncbi:hypothetical protein HK101_000234 [Irineochytrium annulatum]|nr:hypothetical protein HK101_000234 [Irineochytrium annulatum]
MISEIEHQRRLGLDPSRVDFTHLIELSVDDVSTPTRRDGSLGFPDSRAWAGDGGISGAIEPIHCLMDKRMYSYRYRVGSDPSSDRAKTETKYDHVIDLDHLRSPGFHDAVRHLHLGSLFGSGRVITPDSQRGSLCRIREGMKIVNPTVVRVSESISALLGGSEGYVGVMVRSGAKQFQSKINETLSNIMGKLEAHEMSLCKKSGGAKFGSGIGEEALTSNPGLSPSIFARLQQCGRKAPLNPSSRCPRYDGEGIHGPILFLATDAREPARDPALAPLFAAYPCLFTLGDFDPLVEPIYWDEALRGEMVVEDVDEDGVAADDDAGGVGATGRSRGGDWARKSVIQIDQRTGGLARIMTGRTGKLMIPFIDLMVASGGVEVFGTPRSTFSGYAQRVHEARTKGLEC